MLHKYRGPVISRYQPGVCPILDYVHVKISITNKSTYNNNNKKARDGVANLKETLSREFLEKIFLWGD